MPDNIRELLDITMRVTALQWGHIHDLPVTVPGRDRLVDEANSVINLVQLISLSFAEMNNNGNLEGAKVLPEGLLAYGAQSPGI